MRSSATRNERKGTEMTREHRQMITQQVLYGMVLPAAIYAVASHFMSTILALVVASLLPVPDVVKAKVKGNNAAAASLGFRSGAVVTTPRRLRRASPRPARGPVRRHRDHGPGGGGVSRGTDAHPTERRERGPEGPRFSHSPSARGFGLAGGPEVRQPHGAPPDGLVGQAGPPPALA